MAAEYEVNIKINTGNAQDQLKTIESSVAKIGKAEKQSAGTTDRRVAAMVKLRDIGNAVSELERKGLDLSKARFQVKKAGEAIDKKMFLTANSRMGVAVKELNAQRTITKELERQEKTRRRQRAKRAEGVALGAGFPMLFGGGAGSVLGGAAGGLAGSFGAQIALSALGQQVDKFVADMVAVGQALNSTGGTLDLVREKSLFSSSAIEERAAALEELGKVEELAALLTEELTGKIGNEGVRSLQELGKTTDETTRLWNELTTQLFALVSGPLNNFLQIVNQVLGAVAGAGRREAFFGDLGAQEKAARTRFKNLTGESLGTGRSGTEARKKAEATGQVFLSQEAALAQIKKEFQPVNPVSIPITAEDRRRFAGKGTGADKAAREEERLQKRLDRLEAERQKVLDVSRFRDKIAAASAAENEQLVVRLNGEQKIVEIEAKRKKDLAETTFQREKDAINIGAATQKLAAQRDTERELNELQRQRQEKFENTIESLDHQLALARATTEEERERLRIEEQIRRLRGDDKLSDPQLAGIKLRMEALAEENNLANTFIRQTKEEIEKLNNPMFQVIELSKTLGNAFSESFRGIIDGSMTAQQALANLFQRTADHFLDMAAEMIAAQIKMQILNIGLSFFGGGNPGKALNLAGVSEYSNVNANTRIMPFANGGRPPVGRPSLVGERGPELFVPGASGTIIPNHAMGGANVTVNVDASGSSVEGDGDQAAQLGKMLGAAVQAELIKQKRPGGLLAS